MSRSRRTPSFAIVRECFIVSPQEGHSMVSALSGTRGKSSMTGTGGVSYGIRDSTETGGSATGLSATDAWHGAAVGDEPYVRLTRTVARSSFRQKARNLDSTDGAILQNHGGPRNFVPAAPAGG